MIGHAFRAALLVCTAHWAHAQEPCRQALAFALDVSGSVDSREYRLQLDGLASALRHPDVMQALLAMPGTPVELAAFEWSGPSDQTMVMPWKRIASQGDILEVSALLQNTRRAPSDQTTALGEAMRYGARLLGQRDHCWKQTLDISGDGKSNTGTEPVSIRRGLDVGLTFNALVIGADPLDHGDSRQAEIGELSSYFNANVISGPDSFVQVAIGFDDYERAMVLKLKRELQGFALSSLDPPSALPTALRSETN